MPRAKKTSGGYTPTQIGQEGEAFVRLVLKRRVFGVRKFRTTFLGETAALFDFVVEMVDGSGRSHGQFCLMQVKSTEKQDVDGGIPIRFSLEEVESARKRKIPTYLVGVKITDRDQEGYLLAIDANRSTPYDTMPKLFNMDSPEVLQRLYDEVVGFYSSMSTGEFVSVFTED